MKKYDWKDLTFLIPLRIDTIERIENLQMAVGYLLNHAKTNIIILEAYERQTGVIPKLFKSNQVEYHYIEDPDPIFHATKHRNSLTKLATTPYVAIWDSDVIISPKQIDESLKILKGEKIKFMIPYDGRFFDTGINARKIFLKTGDIKDLETRTEEMNMLYGTFACGGGVMVNRETYMANGMENEYMYGWGLEDGERVRRWEILGYSTLRVIGPLFHLSHPRGFNSSYTSQKHVTNTIKEYLKITSMMPEQLRAEVAEWGK